MKEWNKYDVKYNIICDWHFTYAGISKTNMTVKQGIPNWP